MAASLAAPRPDPSPSLYVRPGFDFAAIAGHTLTQWSGYAFVAIDAAGRVLLMSGNMQTLMGWTPEDVAAADFFSTFFPNLRAGARAREALYAFLDSGETNAVFHWTVRRRDGVERTVWSNTVGLPGGPGRRWGGAFMSWRDVTEYPGALGYDRATQRGFQELVESAPDVIVRFRVGDRRCVYVNRAVERVTGHAPAEFYRDAGLWMRLIAAEDRPAFDAAFSAVAAGETRELDYRLQIGDRALFLTHKLYPIKDDTGAPFAIEGIVHDLSDRRALERRLNQLLDDKEAANRALEARMRELEAANEQLRSLDRLKSEILANVSHELRTPLVTICGYAELLLDTGLGSLSKKQRQALQVVRRSGRRLSALIENMLEYAKIENGRVVLNRVRCDLRALIEEAADEARARLAARGITFTVSLPARPVPVVGDRLRLLTVLRNLLGNAEKFTDEKGRIELSLSGKKGKACLAVADTGIGIAPEHHEKVFDRFFQVDGSASRRHAGTGLGLAIVREVVELHGGTVSLASEPTRGSRFEVRLPLARTPEKRKQVRRRGAERRRTVRRANA